MRVGTVYLLLPLVIFYRAHAQSVTVSAEAGPDETISQHYLSLDAECRRLVMTSQDAVAACRQVSDEADKYAPQSHYITRRGAYVSYALALIRARKPAAAVTIADKAVAVVLLGHDDASGSSAAYAVRGQAKAFTGDMRGADADLTRAELYQRQGLDSPAGKSLHVEYSKTLKGLLTLHAQVLGVMDKKSEALAKVNEADKL